MEQIKPGETLIIDVYEEDIDKRLDVFLAKSLKLYSRSFFQKLISAQHVKINDLVVTKSKTKIQRNDIVSVTFPPEKKIDLKKIINKELDVQILNQHPDFLIVYKPAGLMVHDPTDTQISNDIITLVDWLLVHFKELENVGEIDRPGIVHRLDMNTSGLLIIPKKRYAHTIFSDMFRERKIQKTYLAIATGHPDKEGTIDFSISRHPQQKTRMTHTIQTGRSATTHYKVLEYFKDCSLLELKPITGRTHQIRVHLAAIGHPIIGDSVYGNHSKIIKRQALHAYKLEFEYKNEPFSFMCPIPQDFENAIEALKAQE